MHHAHDSHAHARDPHVDHAHGERNIRTAFLLNIGFTALEIVGGLLTNSMAILSDALHDLGDSFSLGLTWYLEKVSQRTRSASFTYGYRRFSLLGALITSAFLLFGSLVILSRAVPRIFDPEPVSSTGMLVLAVLGVLVNGFAVLRLRGGRRMSERVVMLHLIEDVVGWMAVLVVSIVMRFVDLWILDPLLSVIITLFVLWKLFGNLNQTMRIFLQSVPADVNVDDIRDMLLSLEGVMSLHDLHIWSLDGRYNVLTVHLMVERGTGRERVVRVKKACRDLLWENNIHHSTIEIEVEDEECEMIGC